MDNIGERIKALRKSLGMSQEELALKAGYKSRASINKIEKERDVPIWRIKNIAKALGTTPEHLAGWDEEASSEEFLKKIGALDLDIEQQDSVLEYARFLKYSESIAEFRNGKIDGS